MKKIAIFLGFIFLLFFTSKLNPVFAAGAVIPQCLTITGKFTAVNYTGGPMQVGCNGDTGRYCHGEIKTVNPGRTFTLTRCSCPPYANGCLVIGKKLVMRRDGPNHRPKVHIVSNALPKTCVLTKRSNICGSNGQAIKGNFKITCGSPTGTPTPTITPSITLTPTPTPLITNTPTPTNFCPVPPQIANVKITCPNCNNAPTPTPTQPTPIPTPRGNI